MPDQKPTNASVRTDRTLPEALKLTSRNPPGFDPRLDPKAPHQKGARSGKTRGGRPPRFPGRTGGR